MSDRPRKKRGVPLNDLDRDRRYVIGHVGTRWEVLGEFLSPGEPWPPAAPPGNVRDGVPRTGATHGRHASPGQAS